MFRTLTDQLQEITKSYSKFEEIISKEVKVEQARLKAQQNQIEGNIYVMSLLQLLSIRTRMSTFKTTGHVRK